MKDMKRIFSFLILLLFIFYFSFAINIFWDTGHYMSYVSIFEGKLPWQSWDIVRGPVFPMILFLSNILFGKTTQGILILSFIFYIIMLLVFNKILYGCFENCSQKIKINIFIISNAIIILNPIIFGYYHALLTEFVAMTISLLMCYLSWKWLDVDFHDNKKKYLFFSLIFFIGVIFSWHLKQPYVTITLFPLIVSTFISVLKNRNKYNIISRLTTIFMCLIGLVISIILWNGFLSSKGIDLNTNRNVTASFGNQLIIGLNNYEIIENVEKKEIDNSKYLNKKEKQKISKHLDKYSLINIYNVSDKLVDQSIILKNNYQNISTLAAVKFIFTQIFKHPLLVIESYTSNYLAISNLYPKKTNDGVSYWIEKDLTLTYCHENCSIATSIASKKSNISYMTDEAYARVVNYEQFNDAPLIFRGILWVLTPFSKILYQLLMIVLPFITIASTVTYIRKNQYNKKVLSLVVILLWYSFLHILVHVATGACIDRYASPVYITTILGIILYGYIMLSFRKTKSKKKRSGKNEKRNKR